MENDLLIDVAVLQLLELNDGEGLILAKHGEKLVLYPQLVGEEKTLKYTVASDRNEPFFWRHFDSVTEAFAWYKELRQAGSWHAWYQSRNARLANA